MKSIYILLFILISVFCVHAQDKASIPVSGNQSTSFIADYAVPDFSVNKVYPNPVKDKVTLEIQADQPGDIQLNLINILGSVVKQWEPVYLNGGDQKIKLDLSAFQAGVYFLRITKSNQVFTQILRKN